MPRPTPCTPSRRMRCARSRSIWPDASAVRTSSRASAQVVAALPAAAPVLTPAPELKQRVMAGVGADAARTNEIRRRPPPGRAASRTKAAAAHRAVVLAMAADCRRDRRRCRRAGRGGAAHARRRQLDANLRRRRSRRRRQRLGRAVRRQRPAAVLADAGAAAWADLPGVVAAAGRRTATDPDPVCGSHRIGSGARETCAAFRRCWSRQSRARTAAERRRERRSSLCDSREGRTLMQH